MFACVQPLINSRLCLRITLTENLCKTRKLFAYFLYCLQLCVIKKQDSFLICFLKVKDAISKLAGVYKYEFKYLTYVSYFLVSTRYISNKSLSNTFHDCYFRHQSVDNFTDILSSLQSISDYFE